MKNYPKWLYHETLPATIVNSEEEEKNLGRGWQDEPVPGASLAGDPQNEEQAAPLTGDQAFDNFLIDNGMDKVSARVQAFIRKAYDHSPVKPAPPADEQTEAEKEEARKALLQKAKDLGLTVHHASGIATIQAAIDAHNAKE